MTAPGTRRAARERPRRRWPRVLAVVAVVLLVAATVGAALWVRDGRPPLFPAAPEAGQSSAQSGSVLDRVTVSGRPGATPTVTLTGSLDASGEKYREVVAGTGRVITEGSPVVLAITAFDGSDGSILSPGARPRTSAGVAGSGQFDALLDRAVTGRAEGSRLLFVRSIAPGGGQSGTGAGGGADPAVGGTTGGVEVDVVDILPSVARGEEVAAPADAPVQVTMGEDGPVLRHGTTPPTGEVTQVLLRGDGPQVSSGDRVLAQFSVTGWRDGKVRETTWDTGLPRVIDLSGAMPGLVEALVDQRVGSRVVVTIPPEQATGDDTLVAVVDVLGTSPGGS